MPKPLPKPMATHFPTRHRVRCPIAAVLQTDDLNLSTAALLEETDEEWFSERIEHHVAICRDSVLEQTIKLRKLLRTLAKDIAVRNYSPTDACNGAATCASIVNYHATLDALDTLQPLRPLSSAVAGAVVGWATFVSPDGPRPLEVLLEQPARLVRLDVLGKLSANRHRCLQGFLIERVGRDGLIALLPDAEQPFNPMRRRAEKLEVNGVHDARTSSLTRQNLADFASRRCLDLPGALTIDSKFK